jgi:putative membrane protein
MTVPATELGPVAFDGIVLTSAEHLAVFILASILVSLVGVRVAAYVSGNDVDVTFEERGS